MYYCIRLGSVISTANVGSILAISLQRLSGASAVHGCCCRSCRCTVFGEENVLRVRDSMGCVV